MHRHAVLLLSQAQAADHLAPSKGFLDIDDLISSFGRQRRQQGIEAKQSLGDVPRLDPFVGGLMEQSKLVAIGGGGAVAKPKELGTLPVEELVAPGIGLVEYLEVVVGWIL
jgi:hypothetical protein